MARSSTTFRKGASGNPRGRPKEAAEVKALAREHTKEAIERLVHWLRSDDARASVQAANALLDRGHGKPIQDVKSEANVNMVREIREVFVNPPERHEGDGWEEDDEEGRLH
jgi:hypothetical protein